jgi:hypothetical protein
MSLLSRQSSTTLLQRPLLFVYTKNSNNQEIKIQLKTLAKMHFISFIVRKGTQAKIIRLIKSDYE